MLNFHSDFTESSNRKLFGGSKAQKIVTPEITIKTEVLNLTKAMIAKFVKSKFI